MDVFEQLSSGRYSMEHTTVIKTVEMHTGGEPTRIIVRGYPDLEGETLMKKRAYARERFDELRQRLMREPRGHKEMYGAIIVPETERTGSGEADIGVLFCHNEGYSTMCGHATIALGRFLVDTQDEEIFPRRKQVHFDETQGVCRLRLHAPCGVVEVTVPSLRYEGSVRSDPEREVRFISVKSFAAAVNLTVEIPEELRWQELRDAGKHTIKLDIACGGAFYVVVQERELGFAGVRNGVDLKRLDVATATLKQLVSARRELFRGHGLESDLEYLYGVIVVDEGEGKKGLGGLEDGRIGVCFFAGQQIDRSPTGSGVSARVALARAKGLLNDGERVRFDSLLSADSTRTTELTGGAAGAFVGSAVPGGRVQVEGRAYYTGSCAFVVEDAFSRRGFLV
ncbi:Diaminopimelate epimerase-like protein [Trametes sanguinea]|nr:Diaminopimelate epimerase-like protein [Trametes sanguinea]